MMTINEVSRLTGVSVRALQYYDRIGLLSPAARTEAGYRLYDDAALEALQQILLYRELQFPLKDIRAILRSPDYDRSRALDQQIELLELRRRRFEELIALARSLKTLGVNALDFSAFDAKKLNEYAAQARKAWGHTEAYREFEERGARTQQENQQLGVQMMAIFARLGALRQGDPASPEAQALVTELKEFITRGFYTCTDAILAGLGEWYAGGGEVSRNIDAAGGEGTAAFAAAAIRHHCGKDTGED